MVSTVRGGPRLVLVVCAVGALLVLAGCGEDAPQVRPPEPTPTADAAPDFSDADLWLSFDDESVGYDGTPEYVDELGGPHTGRVVTANGGEVEQVSGAADRGMAIQFPAKCEDQPGCPRAMVEIAPAAGLKPGESPFVYGASVRLSPAETSVGSNVIQQGRFGAEGGQWKLQVDGVAGEPSCVVRAGADPLIVRSRVSVADGVWHRVVCRRDAEGISIEVDGVADRAAGATGSVNSDEPIRIGSPGVGDSDDQFYGRIDDVFLEIGTGL